MPVTPYGGDGFGFGNGNSGIWLIILVALIFGWGGAGFGGYGGGQLGNNYALISDNATLERKIDGVYSGICDSTFALNNTINNGFASAQNTMTQGFAGLNTALVTQGYEGRIATQGVANTLQNCCCDLKQQIGETNYNIATQANMIDRGIADGFCKTNFNAQSNTRDIVDSQNAGTRAILDKLCQMENNAKDEKIAELQAKNSDLRFEASQFAQNQYIHDLIKPPINPCFLTNNPYGCNCNNNPYGYFGTTIA